MPSGGTRYFNGALVRYLGRTTHTTRTTRTTHTTRTTEDTMTPVSFLEMLRNSGVKVWLEETSDGIIPRIRPWSKLTRLDRDYLTANRNVLIVHLLDEARVIRAELELHRDADIRAGTAEVRFHEEGKGKRSGEAGD